MWNKPTQAMLDRMPGLYETENVDLSEKRVHLHFFCGGFDFYAVEYDPDDRLCFGFTILNGAGEWGYVSYDELLTTRVRGWLEVDRETNWTVKPAGKIDRIVKTGGIGDRVTDEQAALSAFDVLYS